MLRWLWLCVSAAQRQFADAIDCIWAAFLCKLINKLVRQNIGSTNEIKAGTPTVIVLQTRSDVRRCANGLLVICFFALPQRWDAWNEVPLERNPFILKNRKWHLRFRSRNGWEGTPSKSEMDDNLGNETHRHIGVPGCIGPICVYDTLVIEMIAKPTLPIWFSDTAWWRRAMDIARRSF